MEGQQAQPAQARNDIGQMLQMILGWSAYTLEVFVRYEYGERYLSAVRVVLSWLTLRFILLLANLQGGLSWIPGVPPASEATLNQFYLTAYLMVSGVHLLRIWQRNQVGAVWHSFSFGISWLSFLPHLPPLRLGRYSFQITDWMLYRFMEPALCFAVIYYLLPGGFTRSWLLWASIAMLIHNNMVWNNRRERFLDMLDSHIEGGYYNDLRSDTLGQKSGMRHVGYVEITMPSRPVPKAVEQVDMQQRWQRRWARNNLQWKKC